jgi:hypothetical protein
MNAVGTLRHGWRTEEWDGLRGEALLRSESSRLWNGNESKNRAGQKVLAVGEQRGGFRMAWR